MCNLDDTNTELDRIMEALDLLSIELKVLAEVAQDIELRVNALLGDDSGV
jgi:hypothetical protein